MATLASLTLDCFEMLYGMTPMERPDADTLATAVSASNDTTWQFALAGKQFWERGDYAEYFAGTGTAGEVVQFAADHSTASADVTVRRGQRGTSAASSYSIGDVFLKNPPYTHTEIQRYINEVVDSDLDALWYRSTRSLTWQTNRIHYPLNASDKKVERVYQYDIDSATIGAATYDETGGAAEDLWTLSSHGLAVGDPVRFTAVGTGATGYAVNTVYWVAAVPSANTFTISATEGGSAIEGTGDSSGTWTLESVVFNYREVPSNRWDVVTDVDTRMESTGRALLLRGVYDTNTTVYYTAQTRPSSSAISSLPDPIANLIPWGVLARITGGTATKTRYAPPASAAAATISYADSQFFKNRFEEMVDAYRNRLLAELNPAKRWVYGPINVG